jgi:hypothetical protein
MTNRNRLAVGHTDMPVFLQIEAICAASDLGSFACGVRGERY